MGAAVTSSVNALANQTAKSAAASPADTAAQSEFGKALKQEVTSGQKAGVVMSPQLPLTPPFVASPLGQRIDGRSARTDAADPLRFTPTPNSPAGGLPGFTRSQGQKAHKGFDEASRYPMSDLVGRNSEVTRWTGSVPGKVLSAGPAHDKNGVDLGQRVEIQMRDADGHLWQSKTMHHSEVLVKAGDTVMPWQPIARGAGFGEQFASPNAGGPHVHWELKVDGQQVDPTTGRPFDFIFPKENR